MLLFFLCLLHFDHTLFFKDLKYFILNSIGHTQYALVHIKTVVHKIT